GRKSACYQSYHLSEKTGQCFIRRGAPKQQQPWVTSPRGTHGQDEKRKKPRSRRHNLVRCTRCFAAAFSFWPPSVGSSQTRHPRLLLFGCSASRSPFVCKDGISP